MEQLVQIREEDPKVRKSELPSAHNLLLFHPYASQRRKKNIIHNIFNAANREHTEEPEIATAFHNYFEQLYTSSSPSHSDIEECTKFLEPRIKNLMARDLTALLQERRWD